MKKIVLITGASGEIGREIAKLFAQNGYAVAIHYNSSKQNAENLRDLLLQNGFEAQVFKSDLSKSAGARELIENVIQKMGKIDVLINNAGIGLVKPIFETNEQEGREVIELNLISAIECSKHAARDMLKRKKGSIINISSIWGIQGASCETYYSAAKAGLIGFTKALSQELAPSGINVNAIAPGVIDTKMNNHLSCEEKMELLREIPKNRFGSGYDVAKAALFLASADADYITGQTLNISGGFII